MMMGEGGGDSEWTFRWVIFAIIVMTLTPLCLSMFLPAQYDDDWADVKNDVEQQYLGMTGMHSTPEQNIWVLKGIYTPYNSEQYGWTDDGWLYGTKVTNYSPSQYQSTEQYPGTLAVKQADNGIWYYTSVPDNFADITLAEWGSGGDGQPATNHVTNPKEATVYTSVYFDESHVSNVFFTPSSKTESEGHYYYEYTGYRYSFGPLSDYNIDVSGNITKVNANSTSLSLIWYKYSSLSGISGQLTISGSDSGLSYLTSDDIIRAFNSTTYTSTFDMMFNGVQMHLLIRLDPSRLTMLSVSECYNNGYWSVMVYSDAVADSINSPAYGFDVNNMVKAILAIFQFNMGEEYGIDGWVGFLISMFYTIVFYSVLLVIALKNPMMFIIVALIALIQVVTSFFGSGAGIFGGLFG